MERNGKRFTRPKSYSASEISIALRKAKNLTMKDIKACKTIMMLEKISLRMLNICTAIKMMKMLLIMSTMMSRIRRIGMIKSKMMHKTFTNER